MPDNPIIPYIEGDGIGDDISPAMIAVVDAAVAKAYDGGRQISLMEIYTGEKAAELYDGDCLEETRRHQDLQRGDQGPGQHPSGAGSARSM